METLPSNNLGVQAVAPGGAGASSDAVSIAEDVDDTTNSMSNITSGKRMTAPPAAATSDAVSIAGDVDDTTNSGSNIMSDKTMMAAKERFYEELVVKDSKKKRKKTKIPTEQEYDEICSVLESWRVGEKHSDMHNQWHRNYILLTNTPRSSALRWTRSKKNLKVATKEKMFTIIMDRHLALGHAKDARKIYDDIGKEWYGITREDIDLALKLCPTCLSAKMTITAKQMPLKMILSETIGKRAQMDLIDMTSQPDPDGYCWILRLIDHLSGFAAVRPLKSRTSEECGIAIIQLLCSFPDFDILQSDNGGEFLGNTVKYVNE